MQPSEIREKIIDMTQHSLRQCIALHETWKVSSHIDLSLATSSIRTLKIIKGLATSHHLERTSQLAKTISSVLDLVGRYIITFTDNLALALTDAHMALTQAQEADEGSLEELFNHHQQILESYLKSVPTHKKTSRHHANLSLLALTQHEIEQLSDAEARAIDQIWNDEKILLCYYVNVHIKHLSTTIIKTLQLLEQNNTVLTIVPTYPHNTGFDYTFAFIFTSTLPVDELCAILPLPGTLHKAQRDTEAETYTIQGLQSS